jgi:hypothetical protein
VVVLQELLGVVTCVVVGDVSRKTSAKNAMSDVFNRAERFYR